MLNSHDLQAKVTTSGLPHLRNQKEKKRHGDNQPWLKIGKINLSEKHKEILISETGWLDDSIVNAAQYMLQMHYSIPGLQNTLLGYSLTYEIMRKEFIQILHNGDNHWVTVSTVGLESSHISLYDNLHSPLTNFTKDQKCALLYTDKPCITVQFSNVERQCNSFDCGIHAIAFATSLCCGEDVLSIKYNNKEMRKHLLNCLEMGKITTFPSMQRGKSNPLGEETFPVYCYCRMRETRAMIECCACQKRFHIECDKSISKRSCKKSDYIWKCKNCQG